jgi:ribonuclease BN (tRNA processing enzyme)
MKLTTLGSMGWIPTADRHTCCYLLELPGCDTLIILDAGTGIVRFHEPWAQKILEKYQHVLLVLSHYHLDHIMGLAYLANYLKDKTLCVAGPGKDIYGCSVIDILNDFTRPPFLGRKFQHTLPKLTTYDLGTGSAIINDITVETILQEHSDPSIGIKIAGDFCYLTDTVVSGKTVDFMSQCPMVLHETWMDQTHYEALEAEKKTSASAFKLLNSHSPVNKVVDAAIEAEINQLVLIHLNPDYELSRLDKMELEARKRFPNTILARDKESVHLPQK